MRRYDRELRAVRAAAAELRFSTDNLVTKREEVRKICERAGLGKKPEVIRPYLLDLGLWGLTDPPRPSKRQAMFPHLRIDRPRA